MTNRYICSSEGEVFCQTGWEEPSDLNLVDPLNPCPVPVCELNGQPCHHGDCKAPNYCACEIGWEGPICDICIPLPGKGKSLNHFLSTNTTDQDFLKKL